MSKTAVAIEALHIVKKKTILHGFSLSLPAEKLSVIIGPNGAGKSTLLRALAGLEKPQGGAIFLNGDNLSLMPPLEKSRRVAWIPDHAEVPFAFSVLDTVIMGRFPWHQGTARRIDLDRAVAAIERLGIAALVDRPLTALSSGERQKAMIARALASDAAVLLFDEPCANLDIGAAIRLMQLLQTVAAGGKAVVVTLHDLGLAYRFAEYAACLDRGRLLAAGDREAVFAPAVLDSVFQVKSSHASGLCFDV